MWEIDLSGQIYTMLLSIMLGSVYGLLLDILSTLCSDKGKTAVFVADILFFMLLSVFQFFFFLARTGGEIRGYVFICELLGFFIYKKTLSWPVCFLVKWIYKTVYKLFGALKSRIFEPLTLFFYENSKNLFKIFKKSGKISKKG